MRDWRDNVEVWQDDVYESDCCDIEVHGGHATACEGQPCPSCGKPAEWTKTLRTGVFWWYAYPGCLPDSDARGPYASYKEAMESIREENDDDEDEGDMETDPWMG